MRRSKWWLGGAVTALFVGLITTAASGQEASPAVVLTLDVDGAIAPGTAVEATVETTAGDDGFLISQCRTGTDVCEARQFIPTSGGTGRDTFVVRRNLWSEAGRADCVKVACEIRAQGPPGSASVAIEIDAEAPITRPVLTFDQTEDLVDRQIVEITATGYEPRVGVRFYQCTLLSCRTQPGYGYADENGSVVVPAELRVHRMVDDIDCAVDTCFVLGVVRGNADATVGAALGFDAGVPPADAPTVTAIPNLSLVDGDAVDVTGTGFLPDEYAQIDQCVVGIDGQPLDCRYLDSARIAGDGTFAVTIEARRRIRAADCAEALCRLLVRSGLDPVAVALGFDPTVPPPPLPEVTVEPTTGLVDRQVLTATVTNVRVWDYVTFRQCVVDTGECRQGNGFSVESVPFEFAVFVLRDIEGNDCALVACELHIEVFGNDEIEVRVPLEFDPDAPRADPPGLRVLPATGLWDGQRVELRLEDRIPGDYSLVGQCPSGAENTFDCGPIDFFFDGDDRTSFAVSSVIDVVQGPLQGTYDCASVACDLVLFDASGVRLDAVPISFSDGGATGGYPVQLECVAWPTDQWTLGAVPEGVDADDLDAAVAQVLASDADAVVVIHGGKLVAEGYDRQMSVDSINFSASVSKTFTGTVIGMLVDDGLLELDAPAPVPQWSDPEDPRHEITLRHLMNMAAGLEWSEDYGFGEDNDILQMLSSPDAASYVAEKPLIEEPGTRFHYSTGTTQILAGIISRTLDRYGDDLRAELDARLFDVLGITEELELDQGGTWLGGAFTNMATRDFAKFGLLHLRGGVWEGEQLVSRDWMEFMHEESPASAGYGGQIWRRGGFVEMVGLYGQKVTIRPDLDLVVAVNTPIGGSGAGTGPIVSLFESAAPPSCSDEPVLVPDQATVAAGARVSIDVLANDPGRGANLRRDTLTIYDEPGNGTASVVGSGQVVYTPDDGFTGVDEFRYLVCTDAPYCGTAKVEVTVE